MPITPKEARERREASCAEEFAFRCTAIDAGLAEGRRTVSVRGMSGACLAAVKNAYRKAGWYVSHITDQRDGDYLLFSENP